MSNNFEIVITKPATSVAPEFNFEELEKNVIMLADDYKSIAYTEDMIKDAKKDKAALRKLKDNLNSERIRLEKEYMMPFNSFKEKINKLIEIVKDNIDNAFDNILNAKFDINPKRVGKDNIGCSFCKYSDICFMKEEDVVSLEEHNNLDFL